MIGSFDLPSNPFLDNEDWELHFGACISQQKVRLLRIGSQESTYAILLRGASQTGSPRLCKAEHSVIEVCKRSMLLFDGLQEIFLLQV